MNVFNECWKHLNILKLDAQTTILLVASVLVLYYIISSSRKAGNCPPGPRGWPILGSLPSLDFHSERVMHDWNKKYGPVCGVKMANRNFILLGSYEVIQEAFVKKSDVFSSRLRNCVPSFSSDWGIVFVSYTQKLKEQRKFGLAALREFGMGRKSIEPSILERISELCEKLEENCDKGEPFNFEVLIYEMVSSIISQLVFNRNLPEEKQDFKKLLHEIRTGNEYSIYGGILTFYPGLKVIPPFSYLHQSSEAFRMNMMRSIVQEVEEHKKTRDPSDPRDVIDCFLNEMESISKRREGNDSEQFVAVETSFQEEQLHSLVYDLFLAGSETTSTTFCWLLLYVTLDANIQRKIQTEIDNVLGNGTQLSMAKADLMPYTRAVIQETLRIRPVAPIGIPHIAEKDETIGGYAVQKDSVVVSNLFHIHHDEKIWKDSEKFNPVRHLDADGRFVKSQHIIPFSLGARQCLGQQLVNIELFLITTSLFQRFHFDLQEKDKVDLRGKNIFSLRPLPFQVVASRR